MRKLTLLGTYDVKEAYRGFPFINGGDYLHIKAVAPAKGRAIGATSLRSELEEVSVRLPSEKLERFLRLFLMHFDRNTPQDHVNCYGFVSFIQGWSEHTNFYPEPANVFHLCEGKTTFLRSVKSDESAAGKGYVMRRPDMYDPFPHSVLGIGVEGNCLSVLGSGGPLVYAPTQKVLEEYDCVGLAAIHHREQR